MMRNAFWTSGASRGASGARRAPQGRPGGASGGRGHLVSASEAPRERVGGPSVIASGRLVNVSEVPYLELVLKNVDVTIKNQSNLLILELRCGQASFEAPYFEVPYLELVLQNDYFTIKKH